ncbi:hypothetical protein GCM10009799_39320 [Nocardiopsis rhodophaea]|uniref:Uncharacterized protein n=1 Tax=Nocardiopsis rhodophaea TaxID=280238 RepID=A0ABP5EWW1_9ACTN
MARRPARAGPYAQLDGRGAREVGMESQKTSKKSDFGSDAQVILGMRHWRADARLCRKQREVRFSSIASRGTALGRSGPGMETRSAPRYVDRERLIGTRTEPLARGTRRAP